MNIQNFLKRMPIQLHSQPRQQPRCRSPAPDPTPPKEPTATEHPYKTTLSIGTFGGSEAEQSMVESRFRGEQPNVFERNKTLDDELNNIDRLKQMYESKVNSAGSRRAPNRSVERSSDGKHQSNEKHYLKPSNTPTFVKKYSDNGSNSSPRQLDLKRKESQNRLRQFYQQASLKSSKKDAFTCTAVQQPQQCPPYPHSPVHKPHPKQPTQPLSSQRSLELKQYTARLEEQLKDKISDLEYKTTRLAEIELQNHEYKERLKDSMKENLRLRDDNTRVRQEKDQLETLLKELLYEREREKVIKDKAKTNRPNNRENNNRSPTPNQDSSGKRKTPYQPKKPPNQQNHDTHNLSGRLLSTLRSQQSRDVNRSQLSDSDKDEKKVKVQNILDKLKIKISRY